MANDYVDAGEATKASTPNEVRYGWSDPGDVGEFRWVDKCELRLDMTYQRKQTSAEKVMRIARDWDWKIFSVLLVSHRDDGLWVYDGGHRLRASQRRTDIQSLPCMVFRAPGVASEADTFVKCATMRTAIKPFDKLRARIVAGDAAAIKCRDILIQSGYGHCLESRHSDFESFAELYSSVTQDAEVATKVFSLCARLAGEDGRISKDLFSGMFYLATNVAGDNGIFDSDNMGKLFAATIAGIDESIRKTKILMGQGGMKVAARGIAEVINNKRRTRRIHL